MGVKLPDSAKEEAWEARITTSGTGDPAVWWEGRSAHTESGQTTAQPSAAARFSRPPTSGPLKVLSGSPPHQRMRGHEGRDLVAGYGTAISQTAATNSPAAR